jgi:Phage integrase family
VAPIAVGILTCSDDPTDALAAQPIAREIARRVAGQWHVYMGNAPRPIAPAGCWEPVLSRDCRDADPHAGGARCQNWLPGLTQAAEKLKAGGQWQDCDLVFTTELGTPVDPRNPLRVIEGAAKGADIEGVGIRTLRHSAAVSWLERGVHIKAVADLLGHSSIAITGDVYGHTSDDTARTAVDGLSADLGLWSWGQQNPRWRMRWRIGPEMVPSAM